MRKPWEGRKEIKIVYVMRLITALLRSTLKYHDNQITPCKREEKRFEPFIFASGAPHGLGVKSSTAANTKGAE